MAFNCRCRCHRFVPALRVEETGVYDCMLYRLAEHNLPGSPIPCAHSGSFVNLHPRGVGAFMEVLRRLRAARADLFAGRGDIVVLNEVAAPELAAV